MTPRIQRICLFWNCLAFHSPIRWRKKRGNFQTRIIFDCMESFLFCICSTTRYSSGQGNILYFATVGSCFWTNSWYDNRLRCITHRFIDFNLLNYVKRFKSWWQAGCCRKLWPFDIFSFHKRLMINAKISFL